MNFDKITIFATLVATVVIFSAVLGSTSTYALWNDHIESSTVTISAGTADLEVFQNPDVVDILFPGGAVEIPVTLLNSGDVDLELKSRSNSESTPWVQTLLVDAACGFAEAVPAMGQLKVGESREMCLRATLDSSLASAFLNEPLVSQLTISGSHGPWSTEEIVTLTFQVAQNILADPFNGLVTDPLIDPLDSDTLEVMDLDPELAEPEKEIGAELDSVPDTGDECLNSEDLPFNAMDVAQLESDALDTFAHLDEQIMRGCL